MFEELFEGPIARARQRESPLPEGRRDFLSYLQALGTRAPRSGPLRGDRDFLRNPLPLGR